jgi:hypothetical protein
MVRTPTGQYLVLKFLETLFEPKVAGTPDGPDSLHSFPFGGVSA